MGLIGRVVLNPTLTGTLGLALAFGPSQIREPLLNLLHRFLSDEGIERVISALKWLTVLGIARRINRKLNEVALNQWTWKARTAEWNMKQEVAIITGGCSGIGLETVKQLMRKGVKVAVFDIQEVPKSIEGYANMQYFYCDVTDPSSIAEAASRMRQKWGEPSILINNAGIGSPHALVDIPNEYVTKIFNINIISHFWMIKEFLPAMLKKNKGHIIGIASMASWVAPPGIVDYAATKSGVMALHEGLNQELKHVYKKPGVLSTCVHPSWVRTALTSGHATHLEKTQGKLMKPEDIAERIVQQIVRCRGGQLFMPPAQGSASALRGYSNWLQEFIRDRVVAKMLPPNLQAS